MVWRRLSSRELARLIVRHGAELLPGKRGKGSHAMYARTHSDGKRYKTTVPTGDECVAPKTQMSIRRGLKLAPEDGCSDEQFYSLA